MNIDLSVRQKAFLVGAVFALFCALYNAMLPIYTDEAYYYLWSKHLALGYLDHPPLIAYMIKLFTLFGDSVWQIRLVDVFCFSLASYYVFRSAEYLFDENTAFYSFLIFLFSPAVTMGFTITTPDSPLILFWSASFYYASKAFFEERTADFILAGLLGGLALLSKYTGVLLFFSYFLFVAAKKPKLFLSYKLYLALMFALLAFSPVIAWNASNSFESFAFQYNHGSKTESEPLNILLNVEFIGGMFAVFGPVFFVVLAWAFTKKESYRNDRLFFAVLPALFTILFFLYKGLYKKMELNWVAPAFVSASLVVGYMIRSKGLKKTFYAGLALSILIVFAARFPLFLGLANAKNPHERLFGYEELAKELKRLGDGDVFADHLTSASVLTYHLKKDVFIPTSTRKSEFDRWQKDVNFSSRSGFYVSKDERLSELKTIWKNAALLEEFKAKKEGFREKTFYIYRVSN